MQLHETFCPFFFIFSIKRNKSRDIVYCQLNKISLGYYNNTRRWF